MYAGTLMISHLLILKKDKNDPNYQPDLYYYWDAPLEELYIGGTIKSNQKNVDCMCEICFDIANF